MTRCILSVAIALAVAGAPTASQTSEAERPERGAWLGVYLGEATDDGVAVLAVVAGGPAHQGGLRAGDVLVSLDDAAVRAPGDVGSFLRGVEPGERVVLRVVRSGRSATHEVVTAPRAATRAVAWATGADAGVRGVSGWAVRMHLISGVSLVAIPDELRVHYRAPADTGVLVTRVAPTDAVRSTGLEVGDVLTRVGTVPIREPADFRSALTVIHPGTAVEMEVVRAATPRTLTYVFAEPTPAVPAPAPSATGDGLAPAVRIRLLETELQRLEQRMREIRGELEKLKDAR